LICTPCNFSPKPERGAQKTILLSLFCKCIEYIVIIFLLKKLANLILLYQL